MALLIDSIQARHLFHAGALIMGNVGLVPYVNYDGLGNFSYTSQGMYAGWNGFTLGCWVNFAGPTGYLASVYEAPNDKVWRLDTGFGNPTFAVSGDGANDVEVSSSITYAANTWYFVAARYNPSTEIAIWVNDTKNVNAVGVPASLFVTDVPSFVIGGDNLASALLECKISMFFFCDAVLADVYLTTLYSLGRAMFNQ